MRQLTKDEVIASRYQVVEIIGQGGMGQVYRAVQIELGREVALKLLKAELGDLPGARARFRREARVAAALRHRGAVQIFDFGDDHGRPFLVMEILDGVTLRARLGRDGQPLGPLAQAIAIGSQVADVLVAANAIGLVHRDLKPSNIFLVDDGHGQRAVVADFGLAFIEDSVEAGRLTRDGLLSGTPAYVSPEQALGRELTGAADVYSLGCTLYEMLSGAPPFTDESEVGLVTRHLFSHPTAPSRASATAEIPAALDELVLAMLGKHPSERPDPGQVRDQLELISAGLGQRGRSRGDLPLQLRRDRMVPSPQPNGGAPTVSPSSTDEEEPADVAIATVVMTPAPIDDALATGLAANGFTLAPLSADIQAAAALWAPGASIDELERLAEHPIALVTDTPAGDMSRIAAALRIGVDEVIPEPVRVEELARRLSRAIQRFRGRRRRR